MTANRVHALWLLAFALSACAPPREPLPITPAGDSKSAAVVRRSLPEPSDLPPERVDPVAPTVPPLALPGMVSTGAIYVCVSETGGARHQTTIEFAPKVRTCARSTRKWGRVSMSVICAGASAGAFTPQTAWKLRCRPRRNTTRRSCVFALKRTKKLSNGRSGTPG